MLKLYAECRMASSHTSARFVRVPENSLRDGKTPPTISVAPRMEYNVSSPATTAKDTAMPTRLNPFTLLERTDKWYLGGGKAAMYAPVFPKYLDTPGFWDEAYFADIRLERLFCL